MITQIRKKHAKLLDPHRIKNKSRVYSQDIFIWQEEHCSTVHNNGRKFKLLLNNI